MKKILHISAVVCLLFGLGTNYGEASNSSKSDSQIVIGGKDKQKKVTHKPYRSARYSAKAAKKSTKMLHGQVMERAKVRNYFHDVFNAKPGTVRNFNNPRTRKRYNKGK